MIAKKPSVYLIDSSIYIFRAWFTMPDTLLDEDKNPVNALYGFSDFLLGFLEQEQPVHLACAFDESLGGSFRNEIYPEYKANREPAPPELKRQFEYCRQLVRAAGIAEFGSAEYEADDIIGTLTHNMREEGFSISVITGDKDLAQLISKEDFWWEYAKNKRLDYDAIYKQFGVYPEQIADLLALAGDSVDNIPGVPGVGPKTAARILNKFGTLESALNNIEQIGAMKFRGAKRVQGLVDSNQAAARLSKKLTVLAHDTTLPKSSMALRRQSYDYEELNLLFNKVGFGKYRRDRWIKLLERK